MIPESSERLSTSPEGESQRRRSRHKRHHRRNHFYERWVRPYRRELKNFALFCAVMILSYLFWTAIAVR
jgi:hypothetical protein